MKRRSLIITVPEAVRDAVYVEADRRGVPPGRVFEAFAVRFFPAFVAEYLVEVFADNTEPPGHDAASTTAEESQQT